MNALPPGWVRVSLGEVCVPSTDKGIPSQEPDVPFVGMEHVESNTGRVIEFADSRRYTSTAPRVSAGRVLYGRLRPYLNKVFVADRDEFVSGEFIPIVPRQSLDPRFLMHRLLAPDFVEFAVALNTGDRPRVKWTQMARFALDLPPLDEQRRIVTILEDHLSRLGIGNLGLRTVDSLTASFRRSSLNTAIHSVPILMQPLASVLERIEAGKSFTCLPRPSDQGEWGVVKVSAMTWGEFRPSENKAVPSGRSVDPRYEIREGDILVSRANTENYVGAPVIVAQQPDQLLLSDKSLRLVPGHGVDRDWLITVLSAPATRSQISSKATGTKDSMRNISQKALLSVTIPVPVSENDQIVVAEMATELRLSSERLAKVADLAEAKAGALRRSLLAAAFSGRLTSNGMERSSV